MRLVYTFRNWKRLAYFASALLLQTTIAQTESNSTGTANALESRDIVGPLIAEALRSNPGIKAADLRYQAAKRSIDSAGALPNPRVQLTHFVESIQTRTGPQRQALSLQQSIPGIGKLGRKREIAQSSADALWHSYVAQQFDLVDRVAATALEVAFRDKAIEIDRRNLELLERLQLIVEDRIKAGGDLSDLLKLQVEIERARDLIARDETERYHNAVKLQSLLGNESIPLIQRIDWTAPSKIEGSSAQWLSSIAERSPELAILSATERSLEARERLSKLAGRPDTTIGLNYIRTGDALDPFTPDAGKDPWALMVGMSLPIWGKANNALSLQASLQTDALVARRAELELELVGEGKAWIAKLTDAQDRIHRYDSTLLPLARQAQEIAESSYQSGKASILDLIDSDRALLKLETEYWRAASQAWLARWKLATLSGGLWLE